MECEDPTTTDQVGQECLSESKEVEIVVPQVKNVAVRFIGTGISFGAGVASSSSSSSFLRARAIATVSAEFMEKQEDEPVELMWLDGQRHPKIGTLALTRSSSTSHPQPPFTGKRLRAWVQQEPWNKEYMCARDFWQWFESSNILTPGVQGVCDMRDLQLFGGDYGVLGDTGPLPRKAAAEGGGWPTSSSSSSAGAAAVGSKKWIAEIRGTAGTTLPGSAENNDSSLYQRILAGVVLHPDVPPHPNPPPPILVPASSLIQIPAIGARKRTLFQLGAVGLLRESDGGGNWLALEDAAAAADCDSEVSRKICDMVQLLKRDERVLNDRIALLRRRIAEDKDERAVSNTQS